MAEPDDVRLPANQREFEVELMNELASRHAAIAPVVLEQFRLARVTDRRGSRVGCFTDFDVPDGCGLISSDIASPLDGPDIFMRGIVSSFDGYRNETGRGWAGSMLFHKDGKIVMLECYAYGETWPDDRYDFEFAPLPDRDVRP